MPGPMEPIGASNRPDLFGDGGGAPPTGGDAPPLPVEGVDDGGGDDDMVELEHVIGFNGSHSNTMVFHPAIAVTPMFLGEATAPARPVAGVMADAPIGVCSPFPMGTMAVEADPALSCRDFAALGFRALEALDGAESVGSAAFGRSFAVASVARHCA